MSLNIIKKRRDFLAVAATGRRWITQNFILQVKPALALEEKFSIDKSEKREEANKSGNILAVIDEHRTGMPVEQDKNPPRFGFTVSKKVGNAVQRNRVRRRLREVVRLSGSRFGMPGWDYVLIGRRQHTEANFDHLKRDLKWGMTKLHQQADLRPRTSGQAGALKPKTAKESKVSP